MLQDECKKVTFFEKKCVSADITKKGGKIHNLPESTLV